MADPEKPSAEPLLVESLAKSYYDKKHLDRDLDDAKDDADKVKEITARLDKLKEQREELIKKLAASPDEINKKDKSGKTALHLAVDNGDIETIRTLAQKADLAIKDNEGMTAYESARQAVSRVRENSGSTDTAYLFEHISDLLEPKKQELPADGKTLSRDGPWYVLKTKIDGKDVLLRGDIDPVTNMFRVVFAGFGTDSESTDFQAARKLNIAINIKNTGTKENPVYGVAEDDLSKNASLAGGIKTLSSEYKVSEQERQQLLFVDAARKGNIKGMEDALAHGAALDTPGKDGKGTALIVAAENGKKEAVQWLLDKGSSPNTAVGETPLHYAINSNKPEGPAIIAMLVAKGAAISEEDVKDARLLKLDQKTIQLLEAGVKKPDKSAGTPETKTNDDTEAPAAPSTPPEDRSFMSNAANWIAPVVTFIAGLFGLSSLTGGMGIFSILGAAALAGGAALISQGITGTGFFAPAEPAPSGGPSDNKDSGMNTGKNNPARNLNDPHVQTALNQYNSGYKPEGLGQGNPVIPLAQRDAGARTF